MRPRSGLALKHGVTVLNSPGTIDADYRGEVSVILINLGDAPFHIMRGDRIAQMILAPVTQAKLRVDSDPDRDQARGRRFWLDRRCAGTDRKTTAAKGKPVAPKRKAAKTATQKLPPSKRQSPSQR